MKGRFLLSVFLTGLLVLSCRNREPLVIAYMGSMTGPNADLGDAGRNGVLLGVDSINSLGGIHGRPLEVLILDNAMDENLVPPLLHSLSGRGVEVLIGPQTSVMTRAALPVADKLGICLVSPSATSNEFLGRDDNLIRLSSSTTDFGALYSALLLEKGHMNCGLILDLKNGAYTESWLKAFVSHYVNRGGKILNVQFIDSSRKSDFRDELNLFLESGAGVLVVNASSMDSAALIQELRKMGSSVPVFVSEWAGTDHFIKLGGRAVEGVVVLQPFDPYDESEEFVQFYRNFTERYNEEPSYVAIAAYDATLVVLQALFNRKAGESMKEAILNNSPYEGLQQEIIFNKFGDTRRLALFQEVREGQFRKFE